MVPLILMGASMALQASQSYSADKAVVSYNKKQARWNDRNNQLNVSMTSTVLDTNILRARTEATDALTSLQVQQAEASAYARVQQGAAGVLGGGSYDTILNSFARKANEQGSNILEQLTSALVGDKLQRAQAAFQATTQMNTTKFNNPSAAGYAAGAAVNFFSSTYGVDWGGGSGSGGNQIISPGDRSMNIFEPTGSAGRSSVGGNQFLR